MEKKAKKIGIIICDRYHSCAGGKCFRAAEKREGAFSVYKDEGVQIAAFAHCGGCPGGNIESTPAEMKKNGVEVSTSCDWNARRLSLPVRGSITSGSSSRSSTGWR